MADDNKSEQATAHRRLKAREKGQVVRSRELSGSLSLMAGTMLLASLAPRMAEAWRGLFRHELDLATSGDLSFATPLLSPSSLMPLVGVALVLGLVWLAALFVSLAQGGVVVAPQMLAPSARIEANS